jgi:hypothetical protein
VRPPRIPEDPCTSTVWGRLPLTRESRIRKGRDPKKGYGFRTRSRQALMVRSGPSPRPTTLENENEREKST